MNSQTTEYALRAVVYLAGRGEGAAAARQIAEATGIPRSYLSKLLGSLVQGGILEARRGIGGGFTLARDPAALTALEVVRCVGTGGVRSEGGGSERAGDEGCRVVRRLLGSASRRLELELEATTIAALSRPGESLGAGERSGRSSALIDD